MRLAIDRIETISRAVAQEYDPRLDVVSCASSGGSGRVELLVTMEGCRQEPCVLMVNVTRTGQAELEHELREKFQNALSR